MVVVVVVVVARFLRVVLIVMLIRNHCAASVAWAHWAFSGMQSFLS